MMDRTAVHVLVLHILCGINFIYAGDIWITVDHQGVQNYNCEREGTDSIGGMICKDLDSAINYTVSTRDQAGANSSVTISLPNGVHHITTQTNFGDASVNFIGLDYNVTVVCEYYADNETDDPTQIHTWYFNESESVWMENIHFKDCGFPFRFLLVQQVKIDNCTFV